MKGRARLPASKGLAALPYENKTMRSSNLIAYSLQPNSLGGSSRRGFTVVELLAVLLLISVLVTATFTAAQYVIRNSRTQAANANTNALQTAICNYRHEYGCWPVPDDNGLFSKMTNPTGSGPFSSTHWRLAWDDSTGGWTVSFSNANYLVFDMLRDNAGSGASVPTANPRNIRFIDNSDILAETSTGDTHSGQPTKRSLLPLNGGLIEAGHPLVYLRASTGVGYYNVKFYFEGDMVIVSTNSL